MRHETSRYFFLGGGDYLNSKINKCERTVSTGILYSCNGIKELKQGDQPKTELVHNGQGALLEEFHSVLHRCKHHFCQLFNLHDVKDVQHTELHIAEPAGPQPSVFEVETATETLERYKSQGTEKQN